LLVFIISVKAVLQLEVVLVSPTRKSEKASALVPEAEELLPVSVLVVDPVLSPPPEH
jgi:hypothetical protein